MMCPRNYKTVEAKKAHEGDLKEFDRLQKLAMNGETLTTQQDERKDLLFERIRAFNRSQKESDMPKTSKVQRATCARAVQVLQEDRCGLFVLGDVQTATVEERGSRYPEGVFSNDFGAASCFAALECIRTAAASPSNGLSINLALNAGGCVGRCGRIRYKKCE